MTARARLVLAIDPGSERSAWIGLDCDGRPVTFGKAANADLLDALRGRDLVRNLGGITGTDVVIEMMAPRGMPTSAQEMEALWWAGRFAEAAHPSLVARHLRDAVKFALCGRRAGVSDANVRAALIDRYGGVGGKEAAIGRKARPGPLYGISRDVWAALALAVVHREHPEDAIP
jgi:hypothetical protein